MVKRFLVRMFLGMFLLFTSVHVAASKMGDEQENGNTTIAGKIEDFCLKIFNKDLVEKTKQFFGAENRSKANEWFHKNKGASILGFSTLWTCVLRKWRFPFYLGLAGIGVGGIVFLHNQEYKGMFLERPITSIQSFFQKTSQPGENK